MIPTSKKNNYTSKIRETYTEEEIEQIKKDFIKACRSNIECRLLILLETGKCQSRWVPEGYCRDGKETPKNTRSSIAKYFE